MSDPIPHTGMGSLGLSTRSRREGHVILIVMRPTGRDVNHVVLHSFLFPDVRVLKMESTEVGRDFRR